jgi:hypothetical protein
MNWMSIGLLFALVAACSDPYEETGPADLIEVGQLCTPSTDGCPDTTRLERTSALGANRLDFKVTNEGDEVAEITVAALPPASAPVSDAGDAGDTGPNLPPVELVSRSYTLDPGEWIADRFVQEALFTRAAFDIELRCDGCAARLDYALGSEPLECRADDDCSGGWLCRESVGRCVECLDDNDCAETQTCSLTTYRCGPDEATGCAQASPGAPLDAPVPLALGALLLCALLLRHRRHAPHLLALLAAGGIFATASTARAEPPRAAFNLGVGSRFLTGELGAQTERGIGISVSQELRTTYFGGRVELGASYFLTTQDAPPLSHELEMYSVAIGPQAYIPAGPFQLVVGLDYRHVGLVSNSLVRFTGPDVNYGAAGGSVEVRYRLAPLEFMLRGGYHPVFGLDSALFSIDLAVGLAAE